MNEKRYIRQEKHVILDKIQKTPITIIGVGAVGREIALKLTQMGAEDLTFVDFDIVEEHNIATQGYHEKDINRPKVEALKDSCYMINSKAKINLINDRVSHKSTPITPIVFSCADSMKAREMTLSVMKDEYDLLIDTRMAAEVARVITVPKGDENLEFYKKTFFSDEEAHQDGCTAKSTCYCGAIIAGMAVAQLAKWTREIPIDKDLTYNIFTNDFIITR